MNLPTYDLDKLEEYAVITALIAVDGNTTQAAKVLGVSRSAALHKRKKLALEGSMLIAAVSNGRPPALPTLNLADLRRLAVEEAIKDADSMGEAGKRLGRTRYRVSQYLDRYELPWSPRKGWTRRPRKAAQDDARAGF